MSGQTEVLIKRVAAELIKAGARDVYLFGSAARVLRKMNPMWIWQ